MPTPNALIACSPSIGVSSNHTMFGAAGLPYRLSSEDSVWVTRIGLNYRFGGWGAPLLARY